MTTATKKKPPAKKVPAKKTTTSTATTLPASNYQGGAAAGAYAKTSATATPGSSTNKPATGDALYKLPVITNWSVAPGQIGPPAPSTKSLGIALNELYRMSPADVADLQIKLVGAGLLSAKNVTHGVADELTFDAYKTLLTRASNLQMTPDQTLDQAIKAGAPSVDGTSASRLPFSAQVSDPADIKQSLSESLPTLLGHSVSDAQLDGMVTLYQSLQVKAQRQSYDTNLTGGTATAVEPIDTFAQQQAEQIDPNSFHAKQLANTAKQVLSGLGLGTSGDATSSRVF